VVEDEDRELITVEEAARWLGVKPGTMWNWISRKRFTKWDGLRHIGGSTRIHKPTLRQRVEVDTLLTGKPVKPTTMSE
jgi:hypothetical protein